MRAWHLLAATHHRPLLFVAFAPRSDRRQYADVLFRIYVQKLLTLAKSAPTAVRPQTPEPTEAPAGTATGIIGPLSPAASSVLALTPRKGTTTQAGAPAQDAAPGILCNLSNYR